MKSFLPTLFLAWLFMGLCPGVGFSQETPPDALAAQDAEANRQTLRIPTTEFTVKTNSFQPGGEIEKAFDGNRDTAWHTRWNAPNAYPYYVEIEFEKPQAVARMHYYPRKDGWNGTILAYSVSVMEPEGWRKIQEGRLSGGGGMQAIALTPVETRALRLEVTQGVEGFGSAAEFELYREDPEAGKIAKMFLGGSDFPEFSETQREEMTRAFRELKESARADVRAEARLGEAVLNASETLAMKTVGVVQKPAPDTEVAWRKGGMPWSYLQPTGRYVLQNQPFAVFVKTANIAPGLVVGDFRTYKWEKQTHLPLTAGWNFFIAPTDGILYLENSYEAPQQQSVPTAIVVGAAEMPYFEYGKTVPEEWPRMLEKPNPYGMAEIMTGRCLITASAENAKKLVDAPQALCESYNHLMDTYAKLMGWDENAAPPHRRPQNLQHLLEVDHMYMYATSYRTAYKFDSMKPVLNNHDFREDGWGPWHEIGHTHQVPGYKFQNLTEVTVNIYSLEMQTSLGQNARIDTPEYHQQLAAYFAQPQRNYHEIGDVFLKLCMFWQLRLAFGDEFYPRLHRMYRETELPTQKNEEKVQTFIRISSEASGYDLTPFYEAWGLPPDEKTREEIEKLPKLETPIWENMRFSEVKPAGAVSN